MFCLWAPCFIKNKLQTVSQSVFWFVGRVEALLVSNHEGTPTVHTCQRQKKEKGLSYRKGQGENRWGKLISPTETAALMIMHHMLCYISILPQLKGMTEVNKALLRIQAIGSDRVGDAGPLETRGGSPALESHQEIQSFSVVWLSHITEGLLAMRCNMTVSIYTGYQCQYWLGFKMVLNWQYLVVTAGVRGHSDMTFHLSHLKTWVTFYSVIMNYQISLLMFWWWITLRHI